MSRAKRRTKEERASILRTVKRGPDGKPKRGAVARVASRVGVSEGTIYGWISRDGWPDDDATEAARKQETQRLASALASGLASEEEISQNRDELAATSLASMGALTPEQATAVQLRMEGASINSIARELGRGWNTVDRWFSQPGPVAPPSLLVLLRRVKVPPVPPGSAHLVGTGAGVMWTTTRRTAMSRTAATAAAVALLASCAPDGTEPDIYAATCEDVECPGGYRSEFGDADDRGVVCHFECVMMDGRPAELSRAWWSRDGECFRLENEWRQPLQGDECW